MTHSKLLVVLSLSLSLSLVTTAAADSRVAPYADYASYVTTLRARTGEQALAIAKQDPSGSRCFARATNRSERDVCQRFLQEKALVEAMPTIALAARAKQMLDANPNESWSELVPIGQACAEAADRLAETAIAPLRKVGPYTVGLLKSKLCNALLVSGAH